jgi:flagellar hook-basal body complex protein FliE
MNSINLSGLTNFNLPGVGGTSATGDIGGAGDLGGLGGVGEMNFSDVLKNAVSTVDSLHENAASKVSNMLQGGGGDMNDVMIAVEKADVSFQLMMQVRNKIVSAYQDIEKMQF